jgi:hypothetical protein
MIATNSVTHKAAAKHELLFTRTHTHIPQSECRNGTKGGFVEHIGHTQVALQSVTKIMTLAIVN